MTGVSGWRRAWAPLAAALAVGAVSALRVDDVFYFLHGLESQGMLLATALADGRGFVDLSLPGHPAHVREPPLFYLALAGLIRAFGFRMMPMKLFIWASYAASAGLAAAFLQRRIAPAMAFFASALCLTGPVFFNFLSGPKSDLPFTAVAFGALLLTEGFIARLGSAERARLAGWALATGLMILAAVMMRSLGLALLIAAAGAVMIPGRGRPPLAPRLGWAALLGAPTVAGYAAWSLRNAGSPNPAGYSYFDWFRMDLAPNSPLMTAVDFHAPLMGPPPVAPLSMILTRSARHLYLYLGDLGGALCNLDWLGNGAGHFTRTVVYLLLAAMAALAVARREKIREGRVLVPLYITVYLGAILAWPMDDPRLLLPLMPLAAGYALDGIAGLAGRVRPLRLALPAALVVLLASNAVRDAGYQRACARLPTVEFRPGFRVRFTSREARDSYELLLWAGRNTAPGAVLMYHSPPPCRLISGHECSPVPMSQDLAAVRRYILDGGIDYLVVDEWGRAFPGGAGWFTEHVLRPAAAAAPAQFAIAYQIAGREEYVLAVKK